MPRGQILYAYMSI